MLESVGHHPALAGNRIAAGVNDDERALSVPRDDAHMAIGLVGFGKIRREPAPQTAAALEQNVAGLRSIAGLSDHPQTRLRIRRRRSFIRRRRRESDIDAASGSQRRERRY